MNCETMRERLTARLAGELADGEQNELEAHLAECDACATEAVELDTLWRELGELPAETPSGRLRARFEGMLATEARKASGRASSHAFGRRLLPIAASILVGFGVGYLAGDRKSEDVAALERQVGDLREIVALTLLKHGSVSERLQGVAYGRAVSTEDERVVGALFTRLLEDPNVNVRLAAIDALRPLAQRADRRSQLLEAVVRQESPLVAISLVDLLLESDGPAARKKLEDLSANPKLDPAIRGYLRDRLGRSV